MPITPASPANPGCPRKEWSIILPALNEEVDVGRCFEGLAKLDYDHAAMEVVLMDNGSTDRTVAIAKSYGGRLDVQVIVIEKVNVGALRNAGTQASSGRYLAFLDADCLCEPTWLRRAEQILAGHPDWIIGGFYTVNEPVAWPARLWAQYFRRIRSGEVAYLPTAGLLMERSTFLKIGGFNPELVSNEDCEFCAKAWSVGVRIRAYPELAVEHLGAEKTLAQFVRRQFWHGSNVLNVRALRSNVRAIGMAAYMLGCMIWLLAASLLEQSILFPIVAAVLPASVLATLAVVRHSRPVDLPVLFVLLLLYGFARAFALPMALIRLGRGLTEGMDRKSSVKPEPRL